MLRSRRGLLALGLGVLLVPAGAWAQTRSVLSKEVSVGKSEATLRLEFAHGNPLEIALHDGSVVIDGQTVGSYQPADGLDTAWRTLLAGAVAVDDGALAGMLRDWSPPEGLKGDEEGVAGRIATALHGALTGSTGTRTEAPKAGVSLSAGQGGAQEGAQGATARALLSQAGHLGVFEQALKGLGKNTQLHVGEDVNVAADDTVKGSLVVIQGDARVAGTVDGDIVVVGGTLELAEGSHVTGDVRLADSSLQRDGGSVGGRVVNVSMGESSVDSATRAHIRDEVRNELRSEMREQLRAATRVHTHPSRSLFAPFRGIFNAVGGLIGDLVTILVLALIGMGVVSFAGDKLDTVAETARRSPGRSALVGVAGTFLLIPVWILGMVALAVSIVGIPVMIAWIPLFPLAAVAAGILGYLAVARNVGEWLADSEYRYTGWIRKSNPVYAIAGGLVALGAAFMAAHVLYVVPFFGLVRGLLTFVGVMLGIVAIQIGFGAVILTRGGRRGSTYPGPYDASWESSVDVDVDQGNVSSPAASATAEPDADESSGPREDGDA
ncbi:MAG: hypothetical protein LJF06_12340 [Gemmatimonadetes bacterium]|nr:hypothetical protein [Gemmatimonadota bacterium]